MYINSDIFEKVNDVNDNPPTFEYRNYGSGITVTDSIGKIILTVKVCIVHLGLLFKQLIYNLPIGN